MFLGLDSLKELGIYLNKITTLDANVFFYIHRPLVLHAANAPSEDPDNPFECDSKLCWLKQEELDKTILWQNPHWAAVGQKREPNKPECANDVSWDTFLCCSETTGEL